MEPAEAALLWECLGRASNYLEFGCGGSTLLAAMCPGIKSISTVETDGAWLEKVAGAQELIGAPATKFHVDIGETGEWGFPVSDADAIKWPNYHVHIWDRIQIRPDMIFIDGRFRVATLLAALMHCPEASVLVIHDFWPREHYHAVLPFVDEVRSAETLAVFRPAHGLDWKALCSVYAKHFLDAR
ncbi:hypothetical protein PMI04_009680 [Sphingobium sp. AP49]|uniref:hypothetical protein n=1 Tax=Sphingobium sp. AP49 TaxID=1144307 RepID=UPI0012F64FF9|nr:hypothetical protein [Sphingobium sp. AP49]WHO40830.1 hypothetical protein PMI04_009680 [Sphingobium sp. AP49]